MSNKLKCNAKRAHAIAICLGLVIFLLQFLVGCSSAWEQSVVDEFVSLAEGASEISDSPYITGELIVIEKGGRLGVLSSDYYINRGETNNNVPDLIQSEIHSKLVADKPEEVRTIVLITWEYKKTGRVYRGGAQECQIQAIVKVIDKSSSIITAQNEFTGNLPEESLFVRGNPKIICGDPPIKEIISFINNLPVVNKAAQQFKNSCGAAFEAITFRSSKPPHNSGLTATRSRVSGCCD
jgi:hypothetical protein